MITSITDEQREYFKKLIEECRANYTFFNKQDKAIAEDTIIKLYERRGYKAPKITFAKNPIDLKKKFNQYKKDDGLEKENIQLNFNTGIFWRYWVCYYEFGQYLGIDLNQEKLTLLKNFTYHCPIIAPYEDVCFVSDLPKKAYFNEEKFLHRDGGSCIEFEYDEENEEQFEMYR